MSIVSRHTLRVRCQKGYTFENSNEARQVAHRKIRYLKCRNAKIINKHTPKCVRINNASNRIIKKHHDVKTNRRFKANANHIKKQHQQSNRLEHSASRNHAKGINPFEMPIQRVKF